MIDPDKLDLIMSLTGERTPTRACLTYGDRCAGVIQDLILWLDGCRARGVEAVDVGQVRNRIRFYAETRGISPARGEEE